MLSSVRLKNRSFANLTNIRIFMYTLPFKPLHTIWLKAAVAGSIWASTEIILGSFLHNLKVPFSGTFLAFIGVFLMVAFLQYWNDKGLIWRAGLICALMKSISPSAVIIGPMTGIMMEALLLQWMISLFGNRIFAYMLGGGLAVFSALVHKVTNLLIMYGFDFIGILKALYQYLLKQSGWQGLSATALLFWISGIYLAAGMIAALLGYLSGRRAGRNLKQDSPLSAITLAQTNPLFNESGKQSYSRWLLLLNIVLITGILLLINLNLWIPGSLAAVSFLSFCFIRYRHSLKRLRKPTFWIYFFVITFVATFLWKGIPKEGIWYSDGLVTGLRMNLRALIIMVGFAAISAELKNPIIKSVLYSRGFASLYQALSLAFSALPGIIEDQKGLKSLFRNGAMEFLFRKSGQLLEIFQHEHATRPDVVIVTGDVRQGKTTFTGQLVKILREKGIRTGGFLATGIQEYGQRTGFNLLDLKTGREFPLCSTIPDENRIRYGRYYFDPQAFEEGRFLISPENLRDCDLVIIDEVGPLELNNQGWNEPIEQLCSVKKPLQLWIIRKSLVKAASRKWNTANLYVFDIAADSPSDCALWISKMLHTSTPAHQHTSTLAHQKPNN